MLKQKKDDGRTVVPKDLPMPKYEYQKPSGGSFTYRFEDVAVSDKAREAAEGFCLQNLKLAI